MSTRLKSALAAGIVLIVSTSMALLLAEVAFRIWGPKSDFQYDSRVIRSLLPNVRVEVRSLDTPENNGGQSTSIPAEEVHVGWTSTNNLGFRMIDDVGEKRPDERRILLLGDSYLEAEQVDAPDRSLPLLLPRRALLRAGLGARLPGGTREAPLPGIAGARV